MNEIQTTFDIGFEAASEEEELKDA